VRWLLAMLALACGSAPADREPAAWVEIRGARVAVEVMRSPQGKAQGLSGRPRLDWGRGMLFPYSNTAIRAFWMKDMRFPIDIVWIRDGRISGIEHRVPTPPPGARRDQIPVVQSLEVVDSVLEVPAGFAEASGWRRGDRVRRGGLARGGGGGGGGGED